MTQTGTAGQDGEVRTWAVAQAFLLSLGLAGLGSSVQLFGRASLDLYVSVVFFNSFKYQ